MSSIKIPSALRKLHKYGAAALLPTKSANTYKTITKAIITTTKQTQKRQTWQKPIVSKRIANVLRKKAVREGTFGSYNPETGVGWDVSWDSAKGNGKSSSIASSGNNTMDGMNNSNIPFMEMRPNKETKRERTREARAKKIEDQLLTADDKILAYRLAQQEKKPEPGIENLIKSMMKVSK